MRFSAGMRQQGFKASVVALAGSCLVTAGVAVGAGSGEAASAVTVYASPTGSGTSCSSVTPCSLPGAQAYVRSVDASMSGDIVVQLAGGTYRLTQPLSFTAADSGNNGYTVRWVAAPGAQPIISGARQVSSWTLADSSKNIYVANIGTGVVTRELAVDGKLATRARLPISRSDVTVTDNGLTINNSSLSWLQNITNQSQVELDALDSWTNRYSPVQSITGSTITMQQPAWNNNTFGWDTIQGAFRAGPLYLENAYEFLASPGQWYDNTATGKLYYIPLTGQSMTVADVELPQAQALVSIGGTLANPAHDLAFSGITFTGNSWLAPSSNQGYVDQQSGGYLTGTWSRPANPQQTCAAGCEAIEATRPHWNQLPAAVQISAASNITITGSTFTAVGSDAVGIGEDDTAVLTGVGLGASNVTISNSSFSQIAAGGITIGGIQANAHHPSDSRMINQNFTITGNTIHDTGIDYRDSMGILATYTTNANVSSNELYNLPYSAIALGYGWGVNDPGGSPDYLARGLYKYQPLYSTPTTAKNNTVATNNVHDYMQQMNDGGCFYSLSANPGSHVDRNYCHNGGTFGMYFDEGSRFFSATNNVFDNTGAWLNENGAANNYTGDQTLADNWTNNAGQRTATNDHISGTTSVSGANWGCSARRIIASAGPATATSVSAASFDAVNSPYTTTSSTTSSFGQCADQFGVTTTGPSTSGTAAQDAAYAGIVRSSAVVDGTTATVRTDVVANSAKAGLLIRNTATSRTSAGLVTLTRTSSGTISLQWDTNGDGTTDNTRSVTVSTTAPVYLRLARSGSVYTGSYSLDGSTYTALGAGVTVPGPSATQDAAVIAAQAAGTTGTSELGGLVIGTGVYKTFSTSNASLVQAPTGFTITGHAADTWNGGGQHDDTYAAQYLAGGMTSSSSATVRVTSQQNTSTYAKAGLMLRNSISSPGSSTGYAILAVTPGYGIVLESDQDGDGYVDTEARAAVPTTTPLSLKLTRTGTTVTGQYSTDGATWTVVGTAQLDGAAATQDIGVFSASHSAEAGTASFGPLTVTAVAPTGFSTNGGTASNSSGTFTITGRGADVWGGAPQHDDDYTAYYLPGGAGSSSVVTVRVASQQNTNTYAKAGLMLRDSIAGAGSSQGYAVLAVTPGYGIVLEWDADGDGYLESEAHVAVSTTTPMYLRLTRNGPNVTGEYSTDGSAWYAVGTASLPGTTAAEDIGMFALSHSTSTAGTSTFDSLTVTSPRVTPAPSYTGFSTNGGSTSRSSGTFTITGKGADVWGGAPQHDDDYTAYYLPGGADSSAAATVRVASQQNTNTYAKAGLMLRDSIAGAGSSQGYAVLAVTPGYGIVLEWDADGDGYLESEAHVAVSTTTPMYLRFTRVGVTVTGQYSTDGSTWNTVGNATLPGTAIREDIGMFSLSHDTTTTGTSSFDTFAVTG